MTIRPVAITAVSTAQPPFWIETPDAARRIGAATGSERIASAIARSSGIDRRATAMPGDTIAALKTIGERNAVYRDVAPGLARNVAGALVEQAHLPLGFLAASSCTGYMVPGWDVSVATELNLPSDMIRLPTTQAGCAGGVLSIAQAAEFVKHHPGRSAMAVAVELCSLAFHADPEPGNLVSALLFGDGAGAALLEPSDHGLRILHHRSMLVADSQAALGFDLTDQGFYPRLSLELADVLVEPFVEAVRALLADSEVALGDLSFFLVHPGGPRILQRVREALRVSDDSMRWSYESLRNTGNMSSAAIFDVIQRYLADARAPSGLGLLVAFGPGVSIELLLVQKC